MNNQQVSEEIKKKVIIGLETNDIENVTTQNLWDGVKAMLRGKFRAIQAYLKKQETSNNLPNFTPKATRKRMKKPQLVEGKKS